MFSGIVEATGLISSAKKDAGIIRINIDKPSIFNDLNIGDSIACDGVCLTLEAQTEQSMQFALGAETLQVTGWSSNDLVGRKLNLERSLRFGDRVHGHFVSGHVDAVGVISESRDLDGSWLLTVQAPNALSPYLWKKGSWAINGVSLTINEVQDLRVSVCLVPETLKRTNLGQLQVGDKVNLEVDWMARGVIQVLAQMNKQA